MVQIWTILRTSDTYTKVLIATIWGLVVYSLLVIGIAVFSFKLAQVPTSLGTIPYKHFLSLGNLNWLGYPVFFPVIGLLVYLTYIPFKNAWTKLVDEGVITSVHNERHLDHDELKGYVQSMVGGTVKWSLIFAVLIGGTLGWFEYANYSKSAWASGINGYEQVKRACADPDYWEKELFEAKAVVGCTCSKVKKSKDVKCEAQYYHGYYYRKISSEYGWFYRTVRAQMIFIGILGVLVLTQIIANILLFCRFEKSSVAMNHGLKIRLDWQSPLHEFGLHRWNQALNNVYWGFSIGLLVPIASKFSQRGDELDSGQLILSTTVSLLIVGPIAATIISRQNRLSQAWDELKIELQKRDKKDRAAILSTYHNQRLWPFDRNIASKLGIIVALGLLSYIALIDFSVFIR